MAFRPRDLADRMAGRRNDGYLRETFTLPRDKARTKARDFLTRYPKAAYMSGVESWREADTWPPAIPLFRRATCGSID